MLCRLASIGIALFAQSLAGANPAKNYDIPPKLIHKVEPVYTKAGREAAVQGTVVLDVVIGVDGKIGEMRVISPMGFGLDEEAERVTRQWRFAPAKKNGRPVPVIATVEVNFRFRGAFFDRIAERRRREYNTAVTQISSGERVQQSLSKLRALADQKYPPAQAALGGFLLNGRHLPRDIEGGLELLRMAAGANVVSALYALGSLEVKGELVAKDVSAGISKIRDAAVLGSVAAQYDLGVRYEQGDAVPVDLEKAARHYRLCAARGNRMCQMKLGSLILRKPDPSPRDIIEGVARLELAGDRNDEVSAKLLAAARAGLAGEAPAQVEALKGQLLRAAGR
ncbi:MAG: TonB family protein [Bryobacteraceae bacterium]|nr:TonB family protein [Bryobacteraceae bacterium]